MGYSNNNSFRGRPSSFSRGGAGGSSYGGGQGRRSGGGGNRNRGGSTYIDERKFISKAKPITEAPEYKHSFTFDQLEVNEILKKNIAGKKFNFPTPIQDQGIPHIMNGKDLLGIANTGTGKTAAFLIPLIEKVIKDPKTRVLIITPTRELAEQIADELYLLTFNLRIGAAMCIGGSNMYTQISALRRDPQFVIGTPGRLKDLYDRRLIPLERFNTVVLDEVDRMLDMGFITDIKYLSSMLPAERQSLFFSATMDPRIEKIIDMILKKDHVKVSVRTGETAEHVNQDIIRVQNKEEKLGKLEELLRQPDFEKVLVFINMKWHVDKIERHLQDKGFKVESLHGDKRQSQRSRSLENFKSGRANILLATDVAARGLDVQGITHVINFDIPNDYESYVHRIGRTGRANKAGTALTFIEGRGQSESQDYGQGRRYSR